MGKSLPVTAAFFEQMRRHLHRLRALLPLSLRCALQERSPSRGRRWREMPGVERVEARGQAVLTFDDGPDASPGATEAALEALDAAGAKATFFLVGEQILATPELASEIVARGHEVGVHGQRHFRHDRVPAEESVADIEAGYDTVVAATGISPRFYRPPYGKLSPGGRRGLPPARPRGRLLVDLGPRLGAAAERAHRPPGEPRPRRRRDRPASRFVSLRGAAERGADCGAIAPIAARAADARPEPGHPRRRLALPWPSRGSGSGSAAPRLEKALIVASPGGHLLQMLALEPAWADMDGPGSPCVRPTSSTCCGTRT